MGYQKRMKTTYPGVYYRDVQRVGRPGSERMYYIVFKRDGQVHEEKVGRQYSDDMTIARAARIRAERIENKRLSRKEIRALKEAEKNEKMNRWSIDRLWLEYRNQQPNPKSKSLRTDQSRFDKYLNPTFGDKEPKELIQLDVDRLRVNLLKKRSPQTVKHVLALLKRTINFGQSKQLSAGCDFKISLPTVDNFKTEDLTAEQLAKLVKVLNEDHNVQVANLMRLALLTGMRRGELFKLQWSDVDFERGFITIRNPKGGSTQMIPMNKGAREVLKNHPRLEGTTYIFPGREGKERTDIKRAITRIKGNAGLPKDFRPLHGLRHVYASMLASSGKVDLYTLQKLLTHKSPKMTQRYAHLRDEVLKRGAGVASDILENIVSDTK